jgi:serine/threonine protein kinase
MNNDQYDWRQLKPRIVKHWWKHIENIINNNHLITSNLYSIRVPINKTLKFKTDEKIFTIGNSFVVKRFDDVHGKSQRSFINECMVGAAVSRKAGCRAYAYRITQDGTGYIIMDHAAHGKYVNTLTLQSYMKKYKNNPLLEKEIFKTLKLFYASTNAMHGDLHFENIMVNSSLKSGQIESVRLIDYGNAVYVYGLGKSKNVKDALNKISVFFQTKSGKSERQTLAAGKFNVKFNHRDGSALRDNQDVFQKWWARCG